MRVKEKSERASLKLNIKKTKIMASGPITSWYIEGEKVEVVTDFLFLGSKITADGDCSHEIRRQLLLAMKAMTNLDSVLKSRNITLPTKVYTVKAMVFPVVRYSSESCRAPKKLPLVVHLFTFLCKTTPFSLCWLQEVRCVCNRNRRGKDASSDRFPLLGL